jgi:hypothetical protein
MGVTLITLTGGRPDAFALCERWVNQQTYQGPLQWIVVDDCEPQTTLTMGQDLINPLPHWKPGQNTQHRNMLAALKLVKYDKILHVEDDDWYARTYVETMVAALDKAPLVGQFPSRYYNVAFRTWKDCGNKLQASLCQTGMRAETIPTLKRLCEEKKWLDMSLWPLIEDKLLLPKNEVVGIKGMPGRPGQVAAHRAAGARHMHADTNLDILRSWIGADAELYRRFGE